MGLPHGRELPALRSRNLVALRANMFMQLWSWMPFFTQGNKHRHFVGLNQRRYFCRHLANWLYANEWHYTTLLAITIESVEPLPDDVNLFIDDLLQVFPRKPTCDEISSYLQVNPRLYNWFKQGSWNPRINSFCLTKQKPERLPVGNLPALTDRNELAWWLGLSNNQLLWLANTWRNDSNPSIKLNHYHYSLIEKRRGGMRLIESPKSLLRDIQRRVTTGILSKIAIHDAAHGFCRRRSCLTHAANHSGKKHLLLFDIAHCFQSIEWRSVYRVFKNSGYPKDVASYFSCLCTHRIQSNDEIFYKLDHEQQIRVSTRHLPQGAPTSPTLSNIVLYGLDRRLKGLATSLQLTYSRYADDLAFSGNQHRDWKFLETLVGAICLEEGFELNFHKSRILKSNQRQKLTGIVVNEKINVDRREYDRLKAILVNCVRYGIDSQNREKHPDFCAHLLGRINYISTLNHRKGDKLRSIFERIASG